MITEKNFEVATKKVQKKEDNTMVTQTAGSNQLLTFADRVHEEALFWGARRGYMHDLTPLAVCVSRRPESSLGLDAYPLWEACRIAAENAGTGEHTSTVRLTFPTLSL